MRISLSYLQRTQQQNYLHKFYGLTHIVNRHRQCWREREGDRKKIEAKAAAATTTSFRIFYLSLILLCTYTQYAHRRHYRSTIYNRHHFPSLWRCSTFQLIPLSIVWSVSACSKNIFVHVQYNGLLCHILCCLVIHGFFCFTLFSTFPFVHKTIY